MAKPYRLEYLQLFYDDLESSVSYIAITLQNPKAAEKLIDNVKAAIRRRLPVADLFEKYYSKKKEGIHITGFMCAITSFITLLLKRNPRK